MIEDIHDEYFNWMYELVCDNRYNKRTTYRNLLAYLYGTPFRYTLRMDENRAEDGRMLRYRFGSENGYRHAYIERELDIRPCSVLEMMIALALRCEEHIMEDSDMGNRMGQWFWTMIVNLELGHMTDAHFDPEYVEHRLDIFMDRLYGRNGEGGLFRIENPRKDMRTIDIWYQMYWYLDEMLSEVEV